MKTRIGILLCSGNSWLSRKIKLVQRLAGAPKDASRISHVAIHFDQQVCEATTLNKWCGKTGVQKNPFDEWLDNYNGKVWQRALIGEGCSWDDITRFIDDNLSKPYESGIPGLIELICSGFRMNYKANVKNLHCSELDVELLQTIGWFNPALLSNNFPPYTFYPCGAFEKEIENCEIGEMVRLK